MIKFVFLFALVAVLSAPAVHAVDRDESVAAAASFEPKPIGRCPPRDIPNKPPRLLPDANDCRVYYECAGGEMTQKECPEGMCFSRAKKGCA